MAEFRHYRVLNDEVLPVMDSASAPSSSSSKSSGNFIHQFLQNLQIKVLFLDQETIVFDLIGVDTSIANALRRILLAEVPTMAIETIYIQDNTSIVQDEVLSHRLGLVPIYADPNEFEDFFPDSDPTDLNTIVFKLDVTCTNDPSKTVLNDSGLLTQTVYSGDFEWQPQGDQAEKFTDPIRPVHKDIPLVIIKAGQSVRLEAHCHKGIGKDHTKFSPCATASYRLLPDISFLEPVEDTVAEELVAMCPMGVFDIEELPVSGSKLKSKRAVVSRPRDCTMCRECIRKEGWDRRVALKRVANHFIFTVESTGILPPEEIVKRAIQVLKSKTRGIKGLVSEYLHDAGVVS